MVASELLLLLGTAAVFPYMAEAAVDWVQKKILH